MRWLSILVLFACSLLMANAQPVYHLEKVLELQMEGEGGSNGASVAWHTTGKKYYAAMAGNAIYPLCVFNEKGERLSDAGNSTLVDIRGLWFNAKKAKVQGNAYGEGGWFEYVLDSKGIPTDFTTLVEGASQPNEQCVGNFIAKTNQVVFFDGSDIYFYDILTGEVKEVLSFAEVLSRSSIDESAREDYNNRTILYTAKPGQELGLLNVVAGQLELFSIQGIRSMVLKVPESQPVYEGFNLAFANGLFWFFNKDERKWVGYKQGKLASAASKPAAARAAAGKGALGTFSKIAVPGDLYSTYNIADNYPDEVAQWKRDFGVATTEEILKRSQESGWPAAISSLDGRDKYRDRFVDFNCYHVADLGSDFVLLQIPVQENKHMPADLLPTYDYYMLYKRSAVNLGSQIKPKFAAQAAGPVAAKPVISKKIAGSMQDQLDEVVLDCGDNFAWLKG